MSIHLPALLDRYAQVPTAYRSEQDGEGKTADERLVEALSASAPRSAISPKARARGPRGTGDAGPVHEKPLRR